MSISENESTLYDIFIVNSPIIIASVFTSLSFVYQNWTGVIYLFLLVVMCLFRYLIITKSGIPMFNEGTCKKITNQGSYFSIFVFAFTFGYVFLPMFIFNDINLPLLIGFIVYFLFDIGIKFKNGCNKLLPIVVELLSGSMLGFGLCAFIMYALKIQQLLFFNEISSSKDMCTVKNKQAFKCTVAK